MAASLPVRFALIGFGAWGSHHARAIAQTPGAELVAICSRSAASRDKAQTAYPKAHIYADYRDLLARENFDIADVVLPSDLHHAVGAAVLESGRHLLLEKPMALRVADCADLVERARARGRLLAVGHELRLSALWGEVKKRVAAGAIGEPLYALIELWRNPYRLGSQGWRYDIQHVGNWILEEPIHFFDLARWYFAGSGDPISVFAAANSTKPDHPELQDNFSAVMQFPRGRYAVISQTLAGWEHHQTVKVVGRSGALWAQWRGVIDRTFEPSYRLQQREGERVSDIPLARKSGEVYELVDQIEAVVRAVRDGTPPPCSGSDGLWATRMCLAAQQSLDEGRLIVFEKDERQHV
jgi:myo-inositol 2-dehydrogenase/D-chiro-inositol 1-dehydrogenase